MWGRVLIYKIDIEYELLFYIPYASVFHNHFYAHVEYSSFANKYKISFKRKLRTTGLIIKTVQA